MLSASVISLIADLPLCSSMRMHDAQLANTFTGNSDGSATPRLAARAQPLPPCPRAGHCARRFTSPFLSLSFRLAPRQFRHHQRCPAIGQFVMLGSGVLETHPISGASTLPPSSNNFATTAAASGAGSTVGSAPTSGANGGGVDVCGCAR